MTEQRRVAIVLDPLDSLHPERDSSIALMRAAQERGAAVVAVRGADLWCDGADVWARGRALRLQDGADWRREGPPETCRLADFDFVLMRKDPPIDLRYLAAVWLLAQAQRRGARVLNAPDALLGMNEKLAALAFPELAPPTRVSADPALLREFLGEYNDIVVKPLDRMGGAGVRRLRRDDPAAEKMLEDSTEQGGMPVVAQKFLSEVFRGDRRLLLVDGELVPRAAVRIPKTGEFRANVSRGARVSVEPVCARDREIGARLGAPLRAAGVHFAGVDVVGGFVTEINLTSPTCIAEIDAGTELAVAARFWDTAYRRWRDA